MRRKGLFITVEGVEGSGKSTNIEVIEEFLSERMVEYPITREPGGTKSAELIRNLILDSNNPVEMIPSGYWQAAKSTGEFTLMSCCVGPGFDFKDFELLRNTNHTSRLDKAINDLI